MKIRYLSYLVKKTAFNGKILNTESKHITISEYNKFTGEIFDAKIKEKDLFDKSDIPGFISNSDLNKKIAGLRIKAELKAEQDKITKPQAFHSSYFQVIW